MMTNKSSQTSDKTWIRAQGNGSCLSVHILPASSRSTIVGFHDHRLKVKIQALPIDGEANRCLVEFFADLLGIAKSRCQLMQGETSRQKVIYIDLPPDKIIERLKVPD